MKWINSTGGPLIMMEAALLPRWGGNLHSAESPNDALTDYDRACEVNDYIGIIPQGGRHALVLNDEPMQTACLSTADTSVLLIRWEYASDEDMVAQYARSIPEESWEPTGLIFNVSQSPLMVFDSVYAGNEVEDEVTIQLRPAAYAIDSVRYQPDTETSLILHRLKIAT